MEHCLQPGPVDGSVLTDQARHRSTAIESGETLRPVRFVEHGRKLNMWNVEHTAVLALLKRAGFYYLSRLKRVHLDHALLNALIERWRRETQTFHLRHGEITLLLKDMAILAGLRVHGIPVTGRTDFHWEQLCMELLGQVPDQIKGGCVKIDWLYQQFHLIPDDAGQGQIECTARAYIMYQIGCRLFPDPSGNRVHLKYLALLRDFDTCSQMAWGAATLAYLYRELGKASLVGKAECCGFLTLLQIWAWEHLHVGRPQRLENEEGDSNLDDKPLGCRWNVPLRYRDNLRISDIKFYRNELDTQLESQVIWDPYTPELMANLPAFGMAESEVWRSRTPLICYEIVEMHVPDRVLRQFGMIQHIPVPVEVIDRLTRQGRSDEDWSVYHEQYIKRWEDRQSTVVPQHDAMDRDPLCALETYLKWYWSITRRWISTPVNRPAVLYQPQGHIEKVLVDLVVDVRARIREILVDKIAADDVSETLSQIDADITSVMDTLPLVPISTPMDGQEHSDVHAMTSQERPTRRRRSHRHIQPSSSTANVTDPLSTPSNTIPPESILPIPTPSIEAVSFTLAPTNRETVPSTSTSFEPMPSMCSSLIIEANSCTQVPMSMDFTSSTSAPTVIVTIPSVPSTVDAPSVVATVIQAPNAITQDTLTQEGILEDEVPEAASMDSEAPKVDNVMEEIYDADSKSYTIRQLDEMTSIELMHAKAHVEVTKVEDTDVNGGEAIGVQALEFNENEEVNEDEGIQEAVDGRVQDHRRPVVRKRKKRVIPQTSSGP